MLKNVSGEHWRCESSLLANSEVLLPCVSQLPNTLGVGSGRGLHEQGPKGLNYKHFPYLLASVLRETSH